jgi:hypothetical protein
MAGEIDDGPAEKWLRSARGETLVRLHLRAFSGERATWHVHLSRPAAGRFAARALCRWASARAKGYSLQTEKVHVYWAKAFVLWKARSGGGFLHPREMGQAKVEGFLSMLAIEKRVEPATHRQALNALLFLHRQVLGMELPWMQQIGRPLERKYPRAGESWAWFWVFPSPRLSVDLQTGAERRHHLFEERLNRQLKKGGNASRYRQKRVRPHAAVFIRHTPAAGGHRHSRGAGTAGAFGRVDDDD